jgi:tRNA(Ile)-lysidine synthase
MTRGASRGAIAVVDRAVVQALAAAGVAAEDGLLCACSHGPDSLALADALLRIRGRGAGPAAVTLAYVHHGLRPEADAEAERVVAFARQHRAAARVLPVTLDRRRGGGLEEAARAARYRALDACADELGARWIALGHTASDQAETVLGRILRGAGVVGLAGIPPVRGRYLRPLLALPRRAISAYLGARRLTPSHDAMNDDPALLRTRLRHQLLPALRAENPRLDQGLVALAARMREVAAGLDWAAAAARGEVVRAAAPDAVRLDAARTAALPAAVAKRLLQTIAGDLGGAPEAAQLDALLALADRTPGGTVSRDFSGLRAIREYGDLVLVRARGPSAGQGEGHVEVDVTGSDGPYQVRRWRPGDRMRPPRGRGHSRKLQDLFTDRKIPAPQRREAVVVVRESDGEIVWAEHVGRSVTSNIRVALTRRDPPAIYERCGRKAPAGRKVSPKNPIEDPSDRS